MSTKENLQPKGMYTVAEEKGVGPLSGPLKHSWVERRESGLLSDGREWVSTNLAPGGTKEGVGLRNSSLWGQECDERSTSSPQNAKHSPIGEPQGIIVRISFKKDVMPFILGE